MKKSILILFFLIVAIGVGYYILTCKNSQQAKTGAVFFGAEGNQEEKAAKKLISELESIDYAVCDPHERINDAYEKKYGSTTLDTLNFFTITNDKVLYEIVNEYPQIGGFIPFNLYVYKLKNEDTTWVGRLDPYTMADIVGMKDEKLREKFASSLRPLDGLIKKTVETTKEKKARYKSLSKEPMMTFEFEVNPDADLDEWSVDFQERLEELFEDHEYIIAGYKNLKESFDDMGLKHGFDKYWTYSLCHFGISNYVFNKTPEAGVFAPCSIYMYIKKGEKTLHVGMPKLQNWRDIIGITDKEMLEQMDKIEAEIEAIFKQAGGLEDAKTEQKKSPNTQQQAVADKEGHINAYFTAAYKDASSVTESLKKADFEILAQYNVMDDEKLKVILFTDNSLKNASSKPLRGFASVLRVIVNGYDNEIRVTNPQYFQQAFLQDDYQKEMGAALEKRLHMAFAGLKKSVDSLESGKLKDYHFMISMPYYKEMHILAEGENKELLERFRKNSGKLALFELPLENGSTLIGANVNNERFVKKIGIQNSLLLPYTILIENNKAYALHSKYYIALSYPLLTMTEFMTIASTPGNIESSLKKLFKKD